MQTLYLLTQNKVRQPIKVYILLAIVLLTIASCRDHAVHIDPHFVGVWDGTDGVSTYSMSIDDGSNGYWHQNNHGVFSTAQGIARIKHGKLYIGLKPFGINQYPTQDTTSWSMVLSGITYLKQ
jgi:hypothetical protein